MPIIKLENVGKHYNIRKDKSFLLRDLIRTVVGLKPTTLSFWALRNVDLEVNEGESVGIIGRNGAGKSTLLSIMTGTVYPTEGTVSTEGRISALLELGVGFNPDLTGRENVFLNAALLGMSEDQIAERFDSILDFSELEKFIDTPISKYSSGMVVRLGFSAAIHIEPEILIIDEVLAVGDQNFQEKCLKRIGELKARGTTFLMVSHSMESLQLLCDRAIWLDDGQVKANGDINGVIESYLRAMKSPA